VSHLLLNTVLALVWALLTGVFEPGNLAVGFLLGYFILFTARRVVGPSTYFEKVPQALSFGLYFLRELVVANLRVAADVLQPYGRLQPRIIAVPLDAHTHLEVTVLANLIALTPGTIVLDVSTDRRMMYVHAMHAPDADQARREIKDGLERRLLALLRGKTR
jgi:multicomponent Na+:H+ antiporter subunit E